jgi:hypothetical protein
MVIMHTGRSIKSLCIMTNMQDQIGHVIVMCVTTAKSVTVIYFSTHVLYWSKDVHLA